MSETTTTTSAEVHPANVYTMRVLQLLDAHVAQRGGIDPRNYGSWADYRAESRSVTRDRHHYNALRSAVHWRTFTREQWADAFRAFSGRLTLQHGDDGMPARLEYCTGQYFPTEYRRAACAVLASLLWSDARNNMPAPDGYSVRCMNDDGNIGPATRQSWADRQHAENYAATVAASRVPYVVDLYRGMPAGEYVRYRMAREFGRTIAARWFS